MKCDHVPFIHGTVLRKEGACTIKKLFFDHSTHRLNSMNNHMNIFRLLKSLDHFNYSIRFLNLKKLVALYIITPIKSFSVSKFRAIDSVCSDERFFLLRNGGPYLSRDTMVAVDMRQL